MDSPYYFGAKISVQSYSFVSFGELAPFLDELNSKYNSVEATVYDFEPPAAGFSEIAVTVAVAAPIAYLSSLLATWAAEDAKALRQRLLGVMRRSKQNPSGRRYLPMRVELGRVRFYFHDDVTEEELVGRLRAAHEFAASLPEAAFEGEPGPGEYGLYWDKKTNSWKGSIYGLREGFCRPSWMGDPAPKRKADWFAQEITTGDPDDIICYPED